MSIVSVAMFIPRAPKNSGCPGAPPRMTIVRPLVVAPPMTGATQANPSHRIARISSRVGVIETMSPSDASISRSSAGRMLAAARTFCDRSMRCVWAM